MSVLRARKSSDHVVAFQSVTNRRTQAEVDRARSLDDAAVELCVVHQGGICFPGAHHGGGDPPCLGPAALDGISGHPKRRSLLGGR